MIIDPIGKKLVWEWSALKDSHIPDAERSWFRLPSEVKAAEDGKIILFACSGGAIGAVSVSSGELLWYTWSGSNPHSIALLPDGNVATASSNGSFIKIFPVGGRRGYIDSAQFIVVSLQSAHNVIWDARNHLLWSAGYQEIVGWEYTCKKWKGAAAGILQGYPSRQGWS